MAKESTNTRSRTTMLLKYLYSWEVGSNEERWLRNVESKVKITLGSTEWSVIPLYGI